MAGTKTRARARPGTRNSAALREVGYGETNWGDDMKRITKWRAAARRELIEPNGDKRYIRRVAKGQIKESDDVSRSLSQDRRTKAKKVAKAGQVHRGDRKSSKTKPRKKTSART
jgi:hypothetical protein